MRQPLFQYEIVLYNEEVRAQVAAGKHHRFYDDSWGEARFIELEGTSEDEVRAKLSRRYPAAQGFVIESVTKQRG
jgi:hypothetical protein